MQSVVGRETLPEAFRFADWRVDPIANEIARGGSTTRIEPKMMRLLVCLASSAGRPVDRRSLTAAIWPEVVVGDDSLSRLVFQLRRALGDDPRRPRYIETLPKVGYRLAAAVAPIVPPRQVGTERSGAVRHDPSHNPERPPDALLFVTALGVAFSGGWWSARRWRKRTGDDRRSPRRA